METRASYVLVGAFVLTLVAATFAFVVFLARFNLESGTDTYLVNFTGSVQGLSIGSKVRLRGVPIGSVSSIRIDPNDIGKIRVLLDIDHGTPIKEDMTASLALEGITGVASVAISGGTQNSPRLARKSGQDYPEIPSKASSLEKVLDDLPKLFERATEIAENLTKLLNDKNQAAIGETLENLRKVTEVFAERSQSIDELLKEATETAASMRRTATAAEQLTNNLNRRIDPLGNHAEAALDQAQQSMAELHKATAALAKVADNLDKLVEENRRPISDFSATGLYELTQFLAEARTLVANLNQLSMQIQRDPANFFFGDNQKGYEAK